MENTHFTNIKARDSKKLLVYCFDPHTLSLIEGLNIGSIATTTELKAANILLQKDEKKYTCKYYLHNEYKIQHITPSNLKHTFTKISEVLNSSEPRNIDYLTESMLKKTANWNKGHKIILELNKLFDKSKDVYEFTQSLLNLDLFSNFKTVHLFIHEKGMRASNHVQVTKEQYSEHNQNVSEFTQLYNSVKKSKNRSFGQSTLKASSHSIIGTCLAHELPLEKHNLIFLISKDDFLPQEEEDILNFTFITPLLKFYFNQILSNDLAHKNITLNKSLVNQLSSNSENSIGILGADHDKAILQNIEEILEKIQVNNFSSADVNHHERVTLLGELLNTLKHELSNPLFGLQLTTELLLFEDLLEDQEMFVKEMDLAIKRSQSIINNFSEIYNDDPTFEKVELLQLIKEVITLTKSESKTIAKEIYFNEKNVEITKPKFHIVTNQTWLAQVLFNLIINSTQALMNSNTTAPKIIIEIEIRGKFLFINIKDNGPGLTNDIIDNAFKPFFTTKDAGTGLGLSISTSLLNKLSGTIDYITNDNGAHFLLKLPYENSNN